MLNHINIIGRLVKDPELRRTQNGTPVVSFSLAVERDFKDGNGNRQTDFVECVVWRGTAEFIANYGAKGRMIAVSGRLQSRKYNDKAGNPRTAWEVQVDGAWFCDSKREPQEPQMQEIEDLDGTLPF